MKKIIKVLFFVLFICLIVPKVVYAETIHLTKEDFDNAYEHRGRTVPEQEGDVWVDEHYEDGEYIEAHYEDGEWIESYCDGQGDDEESCDGMWVEGHYDQIWVEGYYEQILVEGKYETKLIPEHYEAGEKIKGILAEEEFDGDNYIIKYNLDSNTYILDEDIIFSYDYEDKIISKIVMDSVTVELDLNGHKFSARIFSYSPVEVINSTLHIYGNGAIYGDEMGLNGVDSTIVIDNGTFSDFECNNCDVTINGGTFVNIYNYRFFRGNSNIVINHGDFFSLTVGLILSDQDVNLTINHGNFYGLYTGLAVMNNTTISIHDASFYGLAYGALISSNANTFELEKASFSVDEDTVMNNLNNKFSYLFSAETITHLVNNFIESNCQKVGAVGIVMGNNADAILDEFIADNFVLSKPATFKTGNKSYIDNSFQISEGNVRYVDEDSLSIIANYLVIEGANQTYQSKPITMRANGSYDLFEKLLINGEEVSEEYYTKESGSTIITVSNDYLQNLPAGIHDITLVYINGEAATNLTVLGATQNNPQTADSILTYIFVFMVSIIGFTLKKHL